MSVDSVARLRDVLPAESFDGGDFDSSLLGRTPEVVVRPASVTEIQATLEWATSVGVAVVPLASGRHVEDRIGERPYLALSLSRMADVKIYEPGDLTLTAGAGLTLETIANELRPNSQWLPFDPPDAPTRSLGGLAAVGHTGPIGTGYGGVRNHILGMTVVCGDGRVLRLGGRVVKNVAGFDLVRPMIGSRGRLAVITDLTVRLFPIPAVDRVLDFHTTRSDEALRVARSIATAPVLPASTVWMCQDGTHRVLIRLHGAAETVESETRILSECVGVRLEVIEGADGAGASTASRDVGVADPLVVRLRALPARLGDLFRLAADIEGTTIVADVHRGEVRICWPDVPEDVHNTLTELSKRVGGVGGSLRIVRNSLPVVGSPPGMSPSAEGPPVGGRPHLAGEGGTSEVAHLVAGLRNVFDPGGVFWSEPTP